MKTSSELKLIDTYLDIKETVIRNGYESEIEWQDNLQLSCLSESGFLRESAWVILSTGMRESVIRNVFKEISSAFLEWESASSIKKKQKKCISAALSVFNNHRKIFSISSVASKIDEIGFAKLLDHIETDGVNFLKTFDFIGPITCYHLGKNIGLDVVKPDRHLTRIAETAGFNSAEELCYLISDTTGDRITVVDIVLWRYATLDSNYLSSFIT